MEYSQEQKDIFEFAEKGIKNLIVQAVAGAGKTTTLIECAKRIGPNKRILLVAHNRSTRDTLKERMGDAKNVSIYTLHGLAWRLYTEHFGVTPELDDEHKYKNYITKVFLKDAPEEYSNLSTEKKRIYKANLLTLIDRARQNLKQTEKEIRKMAVKKYGISLVADECASAAKILEWGRENRNKVDFLDLLVFPYEFGYFTKAHIYDVIMLDEAQDVSVAQEDILKRCFGRQTRLFAFGDKDQMINSWCGSDGEVFEHLSDATEFRRPAQELTLTTNYRCGKKIIEYAKQYTDSNIHAMDDAPDGEVVFNDHIRTAKDGDMILCRNAAPLMQVYKKGIESGKKMYFVGEDLKREIESSILITEGDTVEEISKNMKKSVIEQWNRLNAEEGADPKETMFNEYIVSGLDAIRTLDFFPKFIKTRQDMLTFINDVFSEKKEGIMLSTIHKAKGLEADNVYIVCPSLVPSKLAKLPWQIEEERHLQYVMCTRPKSSLRFVDEEEIKPTAAFLSSKYLYKELNSIKDEISL